MRKQVTGLLLFTIVLLGVTGSIGLATAIIAASAVVGLVLLAFTLEASRRNAALFLGLIIGASIYVGWESPSKAAGIYYISYLTGSDSNPGTKAFPWKCHPFSQNNGNVCGGLPTYTHVPGDHFVWMGCDVTPYQVFPITITVGGASPSYDYYGVDQTYYNSAQCPSVWNRPIIAGGAGINGTGTAEISPQNAFFNMPGSAGSVPYVAFEGFEATGLYWNDANSVSVLSESIAGNITANNFYVHNWHYGSSGTCINVSFFYHPAGGISSNNSVNNSTFDGSDSTGAGTVGCGYAIVNLSTALNNRINDINNAILLEAVANGCEIANNTIGNIFASPDGVHPNAIYAYTANCSIHDNVILNNTEGECIYFAYSNGLTTNVFNNVMNCQNLPGSMQISANGTQSTAVINIFNNSMTVAPGESCILGAGDVPLEVIGTLNIKNNLCITDSGSGAILCMNLSSGACGHATTVNLSDNVTMTLAEAMQAGMTAAESPDMFAPTSVNCGGIANQADCPVGKALNLFSSCATIPGLCSDTSYGYGAPRMASVRWVNTGSAGGDGGAYQFGGVSFSPFLALSPTSLTFGSQPVGTVTGGQNVTVTNTGNATMTISSIVASGDFGILSTNCGSSLSVGSTCSLTVNFLPTAGGIRSGAITFTDNASGNPQTLILSGTGILPGGGGVSSGTISIGMVNQFK